MKRKLISLLAVIALLIATAVPTFASSDSVIETEVQHFADGSYAVIETVIESQVSLFLRHLLPRPLTEPIHIITMQVNCMGLHPDSNL